MYLQKAIEQFLSGYFSMHSRSHKTLQAYRIDLLQFRAWLGKNRRLSAITPEMIEGWVKALQAEHYASSSIQRKLIALKAFFQYWVRRKVLHSSPLWHLRWSLQKAKPLPRTLSLEEIQKILRLANQQAQGYPANWSETLDKHFLAVRNRALVELMFVTGMRVGEIASLKQADFNWEERLLIVQGKGRRQRLAFLTESQSFVALRNYAEKREVLNIKTDAFFINVFREVLSPQGIAQVVTQLTQAAGIERRITPHMFRHTVATLLLRNGADLRVVQEFLGHASIVTTQRYTHLSKEHLIASLHEHHPARTLQR